MMSVHATVVTLVVGAAVISIINDLIKFYRSKKIIIFRKNMLRAEKELEKINDDTTEEEKEKIVEKCNRIIGGIDQDDITSHK